MLWPAGIRRLLHDEDQCRVPISQSVIAAAEAHYRAGRFGAAAALLVPVATQGAPAALRLLGLCRLRLGASDEALRLLGRALVLAPRDPYARLHYGIGLQAKGRHAEAARMFTAAQLLLPADPAPLLNLSAALLAAGDVRGAIRAGRRARLRGPRMPQTHYTLGLAYLAEATLGRAAECFAEAARLAPDFADAWVNLGIAHYRNAKMDAAKRAMRAALAADPGHAAAAANLGAFLRLTGEVDAGEQLLRTSIAGPHAAPAARINLAADLLEEGRAAEALALVAGPPPGEPGLRRAWLLQQTLAQIRLGQLTEARAGLAAIGAVPPALAAVLQWRHVLLAAETGDPGQARQAAATMEAMLARASDAVPEHRIMGHYDLAKFWSQMGEPDRAFPHWIAGHRLLARSQPFSRAQYSAFIDATMRAFDATRLSRPPRAANRDSAPVFVVGMPRSGTTLMEQILSAHRDVHGAGERGALQHCYEALAGSSGDDAAAAGRIAALDQATLDTAAGHYLAALHAIAPESPRIIDKMPGNFRYLGLVALMLPGARVIACARDPRDIGLSIFTFRFYGVHSYAHDLADLGWYIRKQQELMAHWRRVLPNPMMTVQLSDWVADFPATLRRVLDFLELPYDPACEAFHEVRRRVRTVSRSQVQEKVNGRGLGRWRPYRHHLAPLLAELQGGQAASDMPGE